MVNKVTDNALISEQLENDEITDNSDSNIACHSRIQTICRKKFY